MPSFLHPSPQLPRLPPPPSFPHLPSSHQFPSGGAFPFGLLPHPLPFLSPAPPPSLPPFSHLLHHHHPPLPPLLNSFLASAAVALLQQQYHAALIQHFMANTPIFNGGGNSNSATTAFGSGGGGGSAGTATASTHGHALRAPLDGAGNRPFVAANSVTGNGQTPRGRIKREPAGGGAKRQKATCEICGKSFGRAWLLNGHMRIHNGEKPYRCGWAGCTKAFPDRSNCRAHERTHYPEKPHACVHCGKAFKLKSYLAKHVRGNAHRHHQPLKQQPKEDGQPTD